MRKNNRSRTNRLLITQMNPRSPISEQYRTVRTNLQFAAVDDALQSLLITSSNMDEGKTMTAANLAIVYAQQGKKVLLIDADLRKPTIHYSFRLDNLRGLSSLLVGETTLADTIASSSIDHLDLIPCGPVPPNPSELLASQKMKLLLEEVKAEYDIVIFDTPPVLAVADAQILANIVDGSILVIRSGQTEVEAAIKAKEALEPAQAKLLGTILNDHEKTADDYYYYYGTE